MEPSIIPLVILFCQNFHFSRDHLQYCDPQYTDSHSQSVDLIFDPQMSAAATCPLHHLPCSQNRGKAKHPSQKTGWQLSSIVSKMCVCGGGVVGDGERRASICWTPTQVQNIFTNINKLIVINRPFFNFENKETWGLSYKMYSRSNQMLISKWGKIWARSAQESKVYFIVSCSFLIIKKPPFI